MHSKWIKILFVIMLVTVFTLLVIEIKNMDNKLEEMKIGRENLKKEIKTISDAQKDLEQKNAELGQTLREKQNAVDNLQSQQKIQQKVIQDLKKKNDLYLKEINTQKKKLKEQEVSLKSESRVMISRGTQEARRKIMMASTAYTPYCSGCSGKTATGINLRANPGLKVIAVDPNVIPLGTKVHVEGYGYAIAADTGGAINGGKIDVLFYSKSEALNWGRKTVTVTILE